MAPGAASAAFAGADVATGSDEVGLTGGGDTGGVVTVTWEVSGEAVGGIATGTVVTSEVNIGGVALVEFSAGSEINEVNQKYPNKLSETMVTRPMMIVNIDI